MDDKTFESLRDKVEKLTRHWVFLLGLGDWEINTEYDRGGPKREKDTYTSCECSVSWPYRRATITFYLGALIDQSDSALEKCVIHELLHVILDETREQADDWLKHEERVCTHLTDAILWVVRATKGEPLSPPPFRVSSETVTITSPPYPT